jgi:TetR/AcrR family transcriptional regulator, ethionamide resistance regulator
VRQTDPRRGSSQSAEPVKRRRRSREAAGAEIVQAAEAFLRERPFRDLSVEQVMARTTLSRSSFYVYFRDRHDLVLRVVEEIGNQLFAMAERWFAGTGDPAEDVLAALEGVVTVYAEHGPVMRAIGDAAAVDPDVEGVYDALVRRFVSAIATHIDEEIAAARMLPLRDASETAFALAWTGERYLSRSLGSTPPRVSRETAVRTLHEIWVRVLYGT